METSDRERARAPAGPSARAWVGLAYGFVAAGISLLWLRYHASTPDVERLAYTDLANYYYPIADLVGRRLGAGELALWNPFSCSGVPLLATLQPGVLYPPTWLGAWLGAADALWFGLWVQVVAAGLFAAAAFRAAGAHWAAASLGGVLYAHACLLGNLAWPPSVATMVWLPFLWLCVEKLVSRWTWHWWAWLAVGTALQLLAGFPQYLVYGFYWLVPYTLFRMLDASRDGDVTGRALAERGAWMVLAVALGVALAAVQLVPTAELARESSRGTSLSPEQIEYLSQATGRPGRVLLNAIDPRPKNPTFDLGTGAGYLGIGSLLAVVVVVARRRRSFRVWYCVGAGALALLLSGGFDGLAAPLYRVYHELPTGGLFRTPERLRFIYMVCLVALSTWGLDALLRDRPAAPPYRTAVAVMVAAVAVALLGGPGAAWRAGVAVVLIAGLLFARAGALRSLIAIGWMAFVVLDLRAATAPAGALGDFPVEVSETYRAAGRKARIDPKMLERLKALPGYTRVEPRGFLPFNAAGAGFGLYRSTCYEPLSPAQWWLLDEVLEPESPRKGALVSPRPEDAPVFYDVASVSRIIVARKGEARVRRNEDALPRAYVVEHAARATQRGAFEHIRDGSFDFQRGVLLEVEGDAVGTPAADAPRARPAEITRLEPERVEIRIAPERDAWLVLTDTWYPGWRARVDGSPARILRANGLYRAVRVPAGARGVVFTYRPDSFRAGLAGSAAAAVAIAAIACAGATRQRRARVRG